MAIGRVPLRLELGKHQAHLHIGPIEALGGQPRLSQQEDYGRNRFSFIYGICRYTKKEVISNSQLEFSKDKLWLTNLITFCGDITGSVAERSAADVLCLAF